MRLYGYVKGRPKSKIQRLSKHYQNIASSNKNLNDVTRTIRDHYANMFVPDVLRLPIFYVVCFFPCPILASICLWISIHSKWCMMVCHYAAGVWNCCLTVFFRLLLLLLLLLLCVSHQTFFKYFLSVLLFLLVLLFAIYASNIVS